MTKIGFVGLGHMGAPMVRNLLKHQHHVRVYDLNTATVTALVTEGAIAARTLVEISQDTEVIITMLPTGDNVHEVCGGKTGLFAHAKPGTLFIDSSSIAVDKAR